MQLFSILFLVVGAYLTATGSAAGVGDDALTQIDHRNNLHKDLFVNYTSSVRPSENDSVPVQIDIRFSLRRLLYLSTHRDLHSIDVMMHKSWNDSRLTWNPTEYGGISQVFIAASRLWKPDIACFNCMAGGMKPQGLVKLSSTGYIQYTVIARLYSHCDTDVARFPYDVQTCLVRMGSWTHKGNEIDPVLKGKFQPLLQWKNKGWELKNASVIKRVKHYECCPGGYPYIDLSLSWRRRSGMARQLLVFPATFIALVVPFVFLLPPGSKQKITLGVSIIIAMTILELTMTFWIPTQGHNPPLISVYYILTLGMTSLSIVISAVVIGLCARGPRTHRVPPLLRKILLQRVKQFVLLGDGGYPDLDVQDVTMSGIENSASTGLPPSQSKLDRDTEFAKQVTTLTTRTLSEGFRNDTQNEWRLLGLVVDRIMFVVYVVIFVIAAIVLFAGNSD